MISIRIPMQFLNAYRCAISIYWIVTDRPYTDSWTGLLGNKSPLPPGVLHIQRRPSWWSFVVRGTYRTPIIRLCVTDPSFALSTCRRYWSPFSGPTGIIILPPMLNCSTNAGGTCGAAAPTWITSKGPESGRPSNPSTVKNCSRLESTRSFRSASALRRARSYVHTSKSRSFGSINQDNANFCARKWECMHAPQAGECVQCRTRGLPCQPFLPCTQWGTRSLNPHLRHELRFANDFPSSLEHTRAATFTKYGFECSVDCAHLDVRIGTCAWLHRNCICLLPARKYVCTVTSVCFVNLEFVCGRTLPCEEPIW